MVFNRFILSFIFAEVLHNSKPLSGSPFTCESFDPSKVVLQGVPRGQLGVHNPISLVGKYFICLFDIHIITERYAVNNQDSGQAELEVIAISPMGQNLPVQYSEQSDGQYIIEFIPTVAGHYKLVVLYGGEQVPNSPITFPVTTNTITKHDARATGNGLDVAHRGQEASFVVHCPTTPNVQIEKFDEHGERIEPKIKSLGNNEWKVSYTIMSVGRYDIKASCPNRGPLPGSPWTVACIDSNKVVPVGGWGQLLDNEGRLILPARFVFDTSQAGPGELLCTVDGRDLSKIDAYIVFF